MRGRYRKYLKILLVVVPLFLLIKVLLHYHADPPTKVSHLVSRRMGLHIAKDVELVKSKDNANILNWKQNTKSSIGGTDTFLRMTNVEKIRETLKEENQEKEEKRPNDIPPITNQYGTCDNTKCNPTKEGMLNVHIVVHSHDDVGWKKTYMQYYNGQHASFMESNYAGDECTQCILSSVIPQLLQDATRRFIFVEIAFFSLWFAEQKREMKEAVRTLIRERRLELIIGGWCMSDSATTYYDDVIDQHTHGFQWIEKELGECAMPKSAWHLDQFGHSREHSSLFAQMGYDGLILGRIDNKDQDRRMTTRNMETIWRTSPDNLGEGTDIFTSVLYDGYFTPNGFGGNVINDLSKDRIISAFLKVALERATAYKTNHILIPYGGDFAISHAGQDYSFLDDLIKYANQEQTKGSKVNVLYSTPTCYINNVNKEGKQFEAMTTDFFPYGITPNTYWTGFFTSRPGLKRHVKVATSLLQTCKSIALMADLENGYKKVSPLKEAVGVLQHHDAITGTEQQHVTNDYNKILSAGEKSCQSVVNSAYQTILKIDEQVADQIFCPDLNISSCDVTENQNKFSVSVFNSLGWDVSYWIRLSVPAAQFMVSSPNGEKVKNQLLPLPESTKLIPERGPSRAAAEAVFKVTVPPLGFSVYHVKRVGTSRIPELINHQAGDNVEISNQYISLIVDSMTGLTSKLKNIVSDVTVDFEQTFLYYLGSKGGSRIPGDRRGYMGGFFGGHKRASGAYAFIPKENTPPVPVSNARRVPLKVVKGENVQEIHQEFSPWVSQVIRLYDGAPYLELEWTVGPIPDEDGESKEVISRFQTNMATDMTWYTDSNGREMIQRKFNFREPFPFNVTCPISGNYYPVTGRIFIKVPVALIMLKYNQVPVIRATMLELLNGTHLGIQLQLLTDENKKVQLTVLTDRSQGGSSLNKGQMELLVHRRTFRDDDLGVEEPLNELGVDKKGLIIRGKHYVLLNTIEKASSDYRPLGLKIHRYPTVSFMTGLDVGDIRTTGSWLKKSLPHNIHLLTLDQTPWDPNTLLLRLENFYETSETPETATLNLDDHINNIQSLRELSLGANHNITEVSRLRWEMLNGQKTPSQIGTEATRHPLRPPYTISLKPMEIRTFHLYLTGNRKPASRD